MAAKKPGELKVSRRKITDYQPDPANPNKHSERGVSMLADSLSTVGLGRSIVVDKNGYVLAGNSTQERAVDQGFEDAIEVETDGKQLVIVKRTDLDLLGDDTKARALSYYDNRSAQLGIEWDAEQLLADVNAGFDFSHLFSDGELDTLLAGLNDGDSITGGAGGTQTVTLSDRFIVPPFSVLDARQGYWQERKRQWLALGIQSEVGRGAVSFEAQSRLIALQTTGDSRVSPGGSPRPATRLVDGHTVRGDGKGRRINGKLPADSGGQPLPLDRMANGKSPARKFAQDLMRGEHTVGDNAQTASLKGGLTFGTTLHHTDGASSNGDRMGKPSMGNSEINSVFGTPENAGNVQSQSGTSIFDPVLCELAYRWFSPPDGAVLDPFAGGSVRGIVAHKLGRRYTGIELRPEQVVANEQQAAEITPDAPPRWITGDSLDIQTLAAGDYDFLFTCPPYADLEIYSDDPRDISNMEYGAFLDTFRRIISAGSAMLKPNRFAAIVVGDVRDKKGIYRNFVSATIDAFQDAGLMLYNEAILVTAVGSLPIRAGKQFSSGRKLGKTHQNVLVFVKGDAKKATAACGEVEVHFPEEYETPPSSGVDD